MIRSDSDLIVHEEQNKTEACLQEFVSSLVRKETYLKCFEFVKNDLKPMSQFMLISVVVVLLFFLTWHWQMFFCALVLLLPTVRLYGWWYGQGHRVIPLDFIISSYAQGFWILIMLGTGLAFVTWIVASVFLYGIFGMMFGFETMLSWFWLVEFLRWGTFCAVEEILKAQFVRFDRIRRQHRVGPSAKAHGVSALSLGLGYASAQVLLFMMLVTEILANNGGPHAQKEQRIKFDEFGWMVFWSLFFGLVTMPLNLMATYMVGISVSKAGEDTGESCCCSSLFSASAPPQASTQASSEAGGGSAPRPGSASSATHSCCNPDVCGFPPGGRQGTLAFFKILMWPVLLRTLLVTQFMCWIVWLPVGVSLIMNVVSIALLYCAALRIVRKMDSTPLEDDIYRSVYGFALLLDDGTPPPGLGTNSGANVGGGGGGPYDPSHKAGTSHGGGGGGGWGRDEEEALPFAFGAARGAGVGEHPTNGPGYAPHAGDAGGKGLGFGDEEEEQEQSGPAAPVAPPSPPPGAAVRANPDSPSSSPVPPFAGEEDGSFHTSPLHSEAGES
eukprot:CAMPEP_0172611494 /NCGR_PEP_ID=MMETSP1068-20121228/31164_1 /TAXON_ID=35684 /ORGANISM="Pseudopedinella elastica, Strain CCMP716" /LENGTH=555 /DNA_ID=CAMNT_0013415477 /DNA_START=69 /DNA_END=1736 /DNA_ORIENTATION=+